VQGYGDYNQLTSSGFDHTELFDDIKDSNKLPEEYDTVFQDSSIEIADTVHVQHLSVKRCLNSDSNLFRSGSHKIQQSASSLYSLRAGHKISTQQSASSLYSLRAGHKISTQQSLSSIKAGRKISAQQSASSLYSLKAIQNDVREIETDLTEVCYDCYM